MPSVLTSSPNRNRRGGGGHMDGNDARQRLENALQHLTRHDRHLLENDLSERCIASRLAMHLQAAFPDHSVDVEYNRQGDIPKRLGLPDEYANFRDEDGRDRKSTRLNSSHLV